jgi:PAS domain S-box-containing protein
MKILYVEDEIAHVVLAQRTLEDNLQQEFVLIHAETIVDALKALDGDPDIDLILSDLRLPDGSGLELLSHVRARGSTPAVVLVTGQGDQEVAVAALKAGAADYLVKQSDYLHRLPVVISNAVAQNRLLREQEALHQAEVRYQSLVEQIPAAVFLDKANETEDTIYMSPRIEALTGYPLEDWYSKPDIWVDAIHPADMEQILAADQKSRDEHYPFLEEYRLIRRDGRVIWVREDTHLICDKDGKPLYWQGIIIDITREKENEAALQRQLIELSVIQAATVAGTEGTTESEIIERVTMITSRIYSEVCGILILSDDGSILTPHPSYQGADISNWALGFPATEGVSGRAVSTGKIIRLGDITKDAAFIEITSNIRSELCVPIQVSKRIIGVINVESREPDAFNENDERLLSTIAGSLGTALERFRLFQAEQQRSRELETLYQTTKLITQSLELHVIAENLVTIMEQHLGYEYCAVQLVDESNQQVVPLAISRRGRDQETYKKDLQSYQFHWDRGITGWVVQNALPLRSNNVSTEPRYFKLIEGINSELCVPLISRNKVIGVINVETTRRHAYSAKDEEILTALASSAAIAFENARLYQDQTRRSRIIETLADIANEIATTRDVIPVLDKITQRALEMLNASGAAIYLLQDDNVTLKTVTAHGAYRNELLSYTRRVGEGITGTVFQNGKAEIINDTHDDPRRVIVPGTPAKEEKLESLMCSPLTLRGKPIGVINAWRFKEDGLFNESELSFLVGIAHQVSICIESGRLFQETSRQAREAAAIAEVGRNISATLELNTVLESIASYALNLLHGETSAVYLTEGHYLRAIAALGVEAEEIKNDPLVLGTGILGSIAMRITGEIINNTADDPRTIIVKGTQKQPQEHLMGVPILLKDKHTGLLAVWRTGASSDFKDHELEFLTSLARQAAVAIENARLYNETQRRVKELEIINRVSTSLRVAQSIEEMLPVLLDETLELIDSRHGAIWLYDHTRHKLVQKTARGVEAGNLYRELNPTEGIVGRTFATGAIYTALNLKEDPLLFPNDRQNVADDMAGIFMPIQSMAGPMGVLVVAFEKGRHISDDRNLLTILAEITGNSIHRVQLYEQSQKQVRKLTTLRDIDSAIASSFDLRLTLNILMDQTANHLNVDAVDIGLYRPEIQSLTYLASTGFQTVNPTRPQMRIGEGLAGQVILKQSILHVTDLQNAAETRNELLIRREGFVTYIGIPLIVKGQIKGVFEVFHRSPLSPTLDWMEFLHTLAGQAAIAIDSSQLFENLQRSNQELMQAYDTTLEGWAKALEIRDRETEGHTRRVTELTLRLARFMGINESEMVNIHRGVLLHDIGKMGVPDNILRKTGQLDENEWNEMRKHPIYARDLLKDIAYLKDAIDIPYSHHEHWDGSGYPQGLKGERIPLPARIFSVVDVWDALLSDRPYRKAWTRDKVVQYIRDVAGTILDPKIVEVFLHMVERENNQHNSPRM